MIPKTILPIKSFVKEYRPYIKATGEHEQPYGFDLRRVAQVEPVLSFLYREWWRVTMTGLDRLPKTGPALIVGNNAGLIPWPALMAMYALMSREDSPRRLNIMADMDWVEDPSIRAAALELGFVPWSSENMKALLKAGELVALFPEGLAAINKPFSERYRVRDFDWTRLLPAIEEGTSIYTMSTIGCDEAIPNILTPENLKKLLGLPALPVTPFFPWLPFPLNLGSFPVRWYMHIGRHTPYKTTKDRDALEDLAKSQTRFAQGEVQAELNRLLRGRTKSYI